MIDAMQNIQLKLTITEVNQILEALGQRPYHDVYRLIANIQQQANAQLSESTGPPSGQLATSGEPISAPDKP